MQYVRSNFIKGAIEKFFAELFFKKATSPRPQALLQIEQLVQGYGKQAGNGREQGDIGVGVLSLPFGDGLNADAEMKSKLSLRHSLFCTELSNIAAEW